MRSTRPIIGVTIGDPAGIGPEISIKASLEASVLRVCKPVLIGDLSVLKEVSERLGLNAAFRIIDSPREAKGRGGSIDLINLNNVKLESLPIGEASAESGRASIQYIEKAVEYALRREVSAISTAPINKRAINMAGSEHIGHTEILAALCGVEEPLTMFWVKGMRIFFLTRHVPLTEAVKAVKKERIIDMVLKIKKVLRQMGLNNPKIAVAALNPHAGDGGLIGSEENKEIIPAVSALQNMGLSVFGPIPADSIFHQALERKYDAVLSLYHDQGHIAAKTLNFYGAVAVTLGLPFIRTSVDHGTAYDIAWKGLANHKSLVEAIKLAAKLSKVYSPE
ncbi:MAG: 4-hydroxythreonine-4-phosphate dehydrogenase PdxA [Candidatus Bathyarchaeota archaeon]|nr:4-hydroxythreonine-4-phosphate dehydrogenase PdxA [Candidatus Bathyarchaeota archaeon]